MKMAKCLKCISAFLVVCLLLVAQVETLFTALKAEASAVRWALEATSFKSATGEDVYPGSRNAKLTVVTRYIGEEVALDPIGCLVGIPRGFTVVGPNCVPGKDANNTATTVVKSGASVFFTFSVNVDRGTPAGQYRTYMNISYYVAGNTLSEILEINLTVSDFPPMSLSIEEAYLTPYNYPGACPVNTVIGIKNNGITRITYMRLTLNLPKDWVDPSELRYTYAGTLNPGETAYLSLGATCIAPSAPRTLVGALFVEAQLVTNDGVVYEDDFAERISIELEGEQTMRLNIIDYRLTCDATLPGFKNTGIEVIARSQEPGVLTLTHAYVLLENAHFTNGTASATFINEVVLNYLESARLSFTGVDINENAKFVRALITLYGSANRDGTEYPVTLNASIVIPLEARNISIDVIKVDWSRTYAYPGSTGNVLVLTLRNNEAVLSLSDAVVELTVYPEDIIYPNHLKAYNILLGPGSLTEVHFADILIPNTTAPGAYSALIRVSGILRGQDGSFKYISLSREVLILIEDPYRLTPIQPIFELIDAYWGEREPQHIYPGNARASLTVIIQNSGPIAASNTLLILESNSSDVTLLSRGSQCAVQLPPGDQCLGVFYLDLSNASSGLKRFNLTVRYVLQNLGVSTVFSEEISFSLNLPEYPGGAGVKVSNFEWLNNSPVFPNTKGAILSLTIANLEPYPIYAIWAKLRTPACMSIHSGTQATVYVPGPVATMQTATVSFTLDLNQCSEGVHVAELELDYYVQTAGGGIRRRTSNNLSLYVYSDERSLEYISSGWVNTPVVPPVYGAYYYVVFRNKLFPQISNPVLRLYLPDGVVESKSNSRNPTVLPTSRLSLQQVRTLQALPGSIASLIEQILPQISQPQVASVSKGDFIAFMFQLNIERADLREFDVPYTISFIDHWGHEYDFTSTFTIRLLEAPPIVEVHPASQLVAFKNGTAILDVLIANKYNATIYNLYVALIPVSGNAIPQNAIKYVERLGGRDNVTLRYTLVFNPVQATIGSLPVTMTSAVFTVTLIYVDTAGGYHSMNTTLAVMISPFIELVIMPGVSARHTGSTLVVNGVLANIGLTAAKSVVIYLRYGGNETMSIVGDIDPGSQVPFRVEMAIPYMNRNCTIVVKYRDEYGSEYLVEKESEVALQVEATKPVQQSTEIDSLLRFVIIAIVGAFLLATFIVIYRYVRRHIGLR